MSTGTCKSLRACPVVSERTRPRHDVRLLLKKKLEVANTEAAAHKRSGASALVSWHFGCFWPLAEHVADPYTA